jgi:hypothetical protein
MCINRLISCSYPPGFTECMKVPHQVIQLVLHYTLLPNLFCPVIWKYSCCPARLTTILIFLKHIATCISVAREELRKYVLAKKNPWPTIGKGPPIARQQTCKNFQLGALQQYQTSIASQRAVNMFLQQQKPCFLCGPCGGFNLYSFHTRVEAGLSASVVALRVVGGDVGDGRRSETVECVREFKGTRTRGGLHRKVPAAYTKDGPVLSSEIASHKNKTIIVKQY